MPGSQWTGRYAAKNGGRRRVHWPAVMLGVLLAGCAVAPATVPLVNTAWPARQAALSRLQNWQMTGRLAVTDERQGWHASLRWQQQGARYTIDLAGPLGQGRLHIEGDEQAVRVRTADGRLLSSPDPDGLLEQVSGVRVPISGLIYWVRGLSDPKQPSELAGDDLGRLTRLEQNGWVVDYLGYDEVADWGALPNRIRAARQDVKVQVAIQEWDIQGPPVADRGGPPAVTAAQPHRAASAR